MHQIAFSTKRTFHGFLRVTRRLFASYGLTAARFDLLHAIRGNFRDHGGEYHLLQSELWRILGVTPPVVSRMLGSLEHLGLVTRARPERGDGRQRVVTLTERGMSLMRVAKGVVVRSAKRVIRVAIGGIGRRGERRAFMNIMTLDDLLHSLRVQFADRAKLTYPWGHPDD